MSLPFRGREAAVPFVTGCHGWRTGCHGPANLEGKIWKEIVSWLENWETATSTVYLLLTLYMTVLPVLLLGDLYASFLGLRMMALFCSNGPPCPTASWAQVSSLKEVPMAPKTLEPLPGDSYA